MTEFLEIANRFADSALSHPGTTGSRGMFTSLRRLSGGNDDAAARRWVSELLVDIVNLRSHGTSRTFLPHNAAVLLDEMAVILLGKSLHQNSRPAVIPGTWEHQGIAVGQEVSMLLTLGMDAFRDDDAPRTARMARCVVLELRSDYACMVPYILFRDVDYPDAGAHQLSLDDFRQALANFNPEVSVPTVSR